MIREREREKRQIETGTDTETDSDIYLKAVIMERKERQTDKNRKR